MNGRFILLLFLFVGFTETVVFYSVLIINDYMFFSDDLKAILALVATIPKLPKQANQVISS